MNQLHFRDPNAQHEIISLYKSSRLIPFFGTGFTKGIPTKKGRVPDAAGLMELIKKTATSNSNLAQNIIDQVKKIPNLKSTFSLLSRPEFIPHKASQSLLTNYFSEADLPNDFRRQILSLDWPHIFTFNIDDAIERATTGLKVLQPNKSTSREYISANRCIFKIHGDISEYAATDDPNLIFTWRDYSHSISKNKAMLGFLAEESRESAFLFIGCSLDAELDLLLLSKETPLSKSIYIKKGKAELADELALEEYGINKVIYFDDYAEISQWIYNILKNVQKSPPTREIAFDQTPLTHEEAINLISNGGPIFQPNLAKRVARASSTFVRRSKLQQATLSLRDNDFVLITGKRFSGKTIFLFQLMLEMQHYGVKYFSSTDIYANETKRTIEKLENHIFVFDSNHLDTDSLSEVIGSKLPASSRIVLCSSMGDAERHRSALRTRSVKYSEIEIPKYLDQVERTTLNISLGEAALPTIRPNETLIDFAFRYHEEFKQSLNATSLFNRTFQRESFLILSMLAAFGKAPNNYVEAVYEGFDIQKFIKGNDRLFESDVDEKGNTTLLCTAPTWLIKVMDEFITKNWDAYKIISLLVQRLEDNGFHSHARELIRVDKLNEIASGRRSRQFIKGIYEDIANLYFTSSHYWLQRAKAELMSADSVSDIDSGIKYAQKVRQDNSNQKSQTYYSATLVIAQLYARAYKIDPDLEKIKGFIAAFDESIEFYSNNKRHMDELRGISDVAAVISMLRDKPPPELLLERNTISKIIQLFEALPTRKHPKQQGIALHRSKNKKM